MTWWMYRGKSPVELPPMISLSLPVSSVDVYQGASVDVLVNIDRQNFPDVCTPSLVGSLSSGLSAAFNPTTVPIDGNTFTMTLTATGGATVTSQTVVIRLTGAGISPADVGITIAVLATVTPAITLATSKTSTSALQGAADSFTGSIARTAYTGDVTLAIAGLATGATAVITPSVLSAGVLDFAVSITNDVSASTVTNDAYTIQATGTGVTASTVNMQHTITAPNIVRGVPDYSGIIKGDLMGYASEAALDAVYTPSTAKNTMLLYQYGMSNEARSSQRTSVSRGRLYKGHTVLSAYIKNSAIAGGTSPPYITSYFSSPGIASVVAYISMGFDPGWTTRGSGTTGSTYKIWALGFGGSYGRIGIEWTGGNGWSFIGSPGGGGWTANGGLLPSTYTNNLTGQTVNGTPGAYGNGSSAGRPNGTQIDAVWAAGGNMDFAISVEQVTARTHRLKFWVWINGVEPYAGPACDVTYTVTGADLPGMDRISIGENFQQSMANRYAPDPCYHHWNEWAVWNKATHPNPLGLE